MRELREQYYGSTWGTKKGMSTVAVTQVVRRKKCVAMDFKRPPKAGRFVKQRQANQYFEWQNGIAVTFNFIKLYVKKYLE